MPGHDRTQYSCGRSLGNESHLDYKHCRRIDGCSALDDCVCGGAAGRHAALSGMAAGTGRNPTDHRAGARRRQHCSVRPAPAAGRAGERAAPRDSALQHRSDDAERQLRWRTRPGTRGPRRRRSRPRDRCGACRTGSACRTGDTAVVALAQPDRAAETLRPELAGSAGENRLEQVVHDCEGRPRDAESGHSDQPGCSRRRFRYRRAVNAARALRPGDRQAERVPHPYGGCQLAAIGWRAHRADAGHRAREGPRRGRVERKRGK